MVKSFDQLITRADYSKSNQQKVYITTCVKTLANSDNILISKNSQFVFDISKTLVNYSGDKRKV